MICDIGAEKPLNLKMESSNKDYETQEENQVLQILDNRNKHKIYVGRKSPVSLLNELSFRDHESGKKKRIIISYMLMDITGQSHRPIYTYMCRVNDKTATGKGYSKKEAKQNSAARMYEKLFKMDSNVNIDKVITSTTNTDNLEVNENHTDNVTSTEVVQIIDVTESEIGDKKLQHAALQITPCDMNPIGTLKELCTMYKLAPPLYSFHKFSSENKNLQQHGKRKIISHEVTCQLFHLQSTGISHTKQKAKQIAARLMIEQFCVIGTEQLNELKSLYHKDISTNKNYEKSNFIKTQEEDQELFLKWQSAYIFQFYVKSCVTSNMATLTVNNTEFSPPHSVYYESYDNLRPQIQIKQNEYKIEPEQFILQCDPDSNSVDQLQTLCQQLGYKAVYMCVNYFVGQSQEDIESYTSQYEDYIILLQVSSIPITVAIGYGSTIEIASQLAAKHVLNTFKTMLLFTSSPKLN